MERDRGGRPQGILVETEQLGQFAAVEGGKWLENHSPTDKKFQGSPPPMLVSRMTRIALLITSLGDNHPLPPTPTCSTRFDAYLHVKNPAGTPQPTSLLPRMKTTRFVSDGGKLHHHVLSSPISMQQDVHLHVLDTPQAVLATPCQIPMYGSPLPPPTMCTTHFDAPLHSVAEVQFSPVLPPFLENQELNRKF